MTCLLCQKAMMNQIKLTDIILLKKEIPTICTECSSQFTKLSDCHCMTCFKEGISGICDDCHRWQEKGSKPSHQSLYLYNEAMKGFFGRYKFEGDYLLRKVFSNQIKLFLKGYKSYTIVPVPTNKERFSKRQFNQVTGFLDDAKVTYEDILIKKDGIAQSKKSKNERLTALMGFEIKSKVKIPQKILLIDDIYTTGATVLGIQKLLYQKGAKEVISFSLAR
ncbi:ComF family protein [Streptococcus sp. CSL10205-OR2]|uniref:ComF family protein n=1 Tax=Streptococcus sp. CSL10205-OR2 TaxID=2980558 RepID=UPI0021DA7334|nr:ComF family protein [Streptococcus sp. CSL10205-OR2]MCU9533503.1 ComF family protein [Streptococcus sp. CSL10205-OR2]